MSNGEREQSFEGDLAPGLDLGGSRSEAYGQAEMAAEGGGGQDDVYERRARRYFNSYAMQFTVSGQLVPPSLWNLPGSDAIPGDPGGFGPKPPRSARMTAIRALGQHLLSTGYLRNTNAANDPNSVFNALVDVEEDMDRYGYQNEDTYLADLLQSSGGIGGQQQERFQPEPFVKPALQLESEEDVEDAVESGITSLLGRKPTDEETQRVISEFRAREKQAHAGMVASRRAVHGQVQDVARRAHEAEQTGGEMPGGVTISAPSHAKAPHPGTLAEEMFEDTDEAKAFHGALRGLDLLNALKGGF